MEQLEDIVLLLFKHGAQVCVKTRKQRACKNISGLEFSNGIRGVPRKLIQEKFQGVRINYPKLLSAQPRIGSHLVLKVQPPGFRRKNFYNKVRTPFCAGFRQDMATLVQHNQNIGLENISFGQVNIEWSVVKNTNRMLLQILQ